MSKSLLSYNRLVELVDNKIIDTPLENINGASIDITLDKYIQIENCGVVSLGDKETISMISQNIEDLDYELAPSEFILASSIERFNLPNNIACEYKLKSSLARSGLQHLLAGWCDPGWTNSKLTLELKNVTQFHILKLTYGMKIGQVIFWECEPVPEKYSYKLKGRYNNQHHVTGSKGVQ